VGLEAALIAAKKGFKVVVIESGALGGTRLHHGSFALHASARLHGEYFKSKRYGIEADLFTASLMESMKAQRAAGIRLARELQDDLEKLNVRVAFGRGTLVDEHRIRITSEHEKQEEIEADYIILATGTCPDYIGSRNSRIVNSDELLDRIHPPAHLFVVHIFICHQSEEQKNCWFFLMPGKPANRALSKPARFALTPAVWYSSTILAISAVSSARCGDGFEKPSGVTTSMFRNCPP
jgi:Pyridine nucleotide-disulphide oxidoreductase